MEKRGFCKKCGKVTTFEQKKSVGQAGDNHTVSEITGWACKECSFMPFLPPKWEEDDGK